MRSRYSAFAVGDLDHVYRTWHPRTRPEDLEPDPALTWTGLEVIDVVGGEADDETGEVEFVARFDRAGPGGQGAGERHERSRFVRRGGRWVYVDGDTDR